MSSLADTGAYLDQLYQEKFGRPPDAAGKAYWKAELDSGKTSADQVAALFDSSDEAKQIKADKEAELIIGLNKLIVGHKRSKKL